MSQKQTENRELFLGASGILALLGIVSAIIQYTNWNWVMNNFTQYESYRLVGIGIMLLADLGAYDLLKEQDRFIRVIVIGYFGTIIPLTIIFVA